jgi:hypothetical protein
MTIADGHVEKLVIKEYPVTAPEMPKPVWQFLPSSSDE